MSTLNYVPNFMFEFFETYTLSGYTGKKVCPRLKCRATTRGSLVTNRETHIMFYAGEEAQAVAHPLDALIYTVLEFYQSRYAVFAYEASQPTATATPETPSPFDTRYAPPQPHGHVRV